MTPNSPRPEWSTVWTGILIGLITLLLILAAKANAQTPAVYDTIQVNNKDIKKIINVENKSGKTTHYAVVSCGETEDLIPVSQTVLTYINLCKENGIIPNLAIKLRNGNISSLIRLKKTIKRKK